MIKTALPTVLAIAAFVMTPNLHANFLGGGVDVGNGEITVTGLNTPIFNSEEELLNYSNSLLRRIKKGKSTRVSLFQEEGRCQKNFAKLSNVAIKTRYPSNKKNLFVKKEYRGHISVHLRGCQSGHMIHDEKEPKFF